MLRKLKIETFSRLTLRGRKHFFRIKAANGEPIAQSEGFSRAIDRDATADLFVTRDFEIVAARR
jgi:hypothetical protein